MFKAGDVVEGANCTFGTVVTSNEVESVVTFDGKDIAVANEKIKLHQSQEDKLAEETKAAQKSKDDQEAEEKKSEDKDNS